MDAVDPHAENPWATTALVVSVFALIGHGLCCIPVVSYVALVALPILEIGALVTGIVALRRARELDGAGTAAARAALAIDAMAIATTAASCALGGGLGLLAGLALALEG